MGFSTPKKLEYIPFLLLHLYSVLSTFRLTCTCHFLFLYVASGCDGDFPYRVCQCRPVSHLSHPPSQVRLRLQTFLHYPRLRVQTLHHQNPGSVSVQNW